MALQISISNAIGARSVAGGGGIDPDAQAFITAASITDPTQQSAINQLVVDLKGYSIWSKMKALYPMVGGTSTTMKFNLKDPRDLDAAFRLQFIGGGTWNNNGYTPNGTNGYADTKCKTITNLSESSHSFGVYSRTNDTTGTQVYGVFINPASVIQNNFSNGNFGSGTAPANLISYTANPSTGLLLGTRRSSTDFQAYRSGVSLGTNTASNSGTISSGYNFFFGARNDNGSANLYTKHQIAFAFLGDGLTNTESGNFYTAVQAFQTTLGRSIGTQTVSDADAQAFVTNAGIVDQVEANAINNLVIGLKADSLWTKMKAIYPFVGGTATTHKYNLKNPLDTDAAFRLVFNGGWTHSSTGSTPNGSNGYADTKLATTGNIAQNSASMGVYSRNNTATTGAHGIRPASITGLFELFERYTDNNFYCYLNDSGGFFGTSVLDSRGFNQGSRTASNVIRYNRNTTTNTGITNSNATSTLNAYIGASNTGTGATFYNNREIAFFYIGDGLTNTEMQNYYTRVQTFQTALNRNV